MTIEEAISKFNELLCVPDEMILRHDLNGEQREKLIELKQAQVMAIEALEKQIPRKPILVEDKMYCCPNKRCWNNLLFKYKVYPNVLNEKKGFRFCLACGQKLEWEEGAEE